MRKIQIERKLFELFGHKFFVFENFKDGDLDIDDQSIYRYETQDRLIDIFVNNQFYAIWDEERRRNATVICACNGNLQLIVEFLQKIGVAAKHYSTFDCGIRGEDRVLFLNSTEAMRILTHHLVSALATKNTSQPIFFTDQVSISDKFRVC